MVYRSQQNVCKMLKCSQYRSDVSGVNINISDTDPIFSCLIYDYVNLMKWQQLYGDVMMHQRSDVQ